MSKQDRQGVRTPNQLEQKYNLGYIAEHEQKTSQQSEKLSQFSQTLSQYMASVSGKFAELESAKVDNAGWNPDKYLGTDEDGNVVEKDKPEYSASEITTEDGETVEEKLNSVLEKVYPVGSVYISVSSDAPVFGGEWELFAEGQIIVGTSDPESEDLMEVMQPYTTCYMWKRTA